MLELWKNLFAIAPFIPHGHCYLWKPGLVSLHIASDLLIALAYYSIPITLLYFVRKRRDLPNPWMFLLFSSFIVACGTTHLMEIWTLWHPTYWLSGCLKAITALVSVVTAIALVPLIPKVLVLSSSAQLEAANRELEQEITERIKVEATLQEREQFLSNIYNSVTDTLWVMEQVEDGEFQVVSMNRAIETSSGTLAKHWIGKRLDELWDIDTATTIRAHYHDCLQQGKTISYEENLPFGEQIRCFLTTLTPLVDPNSRTRLLGVSMDITERKQAENALKESEERWQLALRGNNDGIWDWNVGTNQVFFSARWKEILGYEDCEISHHPDEWAKRVHPDDLAWVMETIQNHFAKKTPFYESEHRILCKDGTYKWILDRGQALWDDDGNAIRMVGSSTDITQSKKAEEELRWKETLLRSMTDDSPLAFFVVDNRSDDILYFNHRFCKIWGIEHLEGQMQRGQLKNNDIVPHCLPVLADVPAFAESCKPLQSEENQTVVEDEIPFSDGRTIRRFSTQICDESDRYFGRLYLFEDVTERKQIEEKLQLADFSLERSSMALAWIDRDARILQVNEAACKQRGYSREELLSMHVWEADPNFSIEVWPQHWQELKEKKTLSFTSQQYTKDGNVIPVEITLNYLEFNGKEYNFACSRDISDRHRAEEALRASQAHLSAILDIADEAIISVDSNQRITLYSQGAERIFGYTSEEMLGQPLDRLLPERFAANHHQQVERFASTTQAVRKMGKGDEILGRRKDGTEFPAEASISQLELAGEKVFIVFLRDISERQAALRERKQAEAALQESEARFQAFMNASPTAAWITDTDGQLLYFNQTYSRMFDLPNDLFGKRDIASLYPPEFAQEYLKNIRKVLDSHQTLEAVELAPLEDGSLGEFLVYKFPLPNLSGEVLVGGVAINLTAGKKAEAALQRREQEFRALVENAPDIIMRLDRECRYLYINPTVERQAGIPPATFIGKTIEKLGAPEALVNLWRTAIEQVFATGCEQNIEYEIPSVAGLTYYASRVVPEFDSDGSVQSVLAIARDISDRKVAEAALEKARDQLEIRVKERTALLVTANKELRQEISDRKQAQAALQTSESRLKEVLDNTAAFISSGRIHPNRALWEYHYYSPNGEVIFGYKGEEFAADPSLWLSRIPAEDFETIVLPGLENLYAGRQITLEYRFRKKDESLRWLSNTLLAKKHKSEDYWFATGIVTDITERKQAEKALQESEQRFVALAETAPVGIFRTDIQGNCVYGNERSFEMIGLSLGESIGTGWATAIHPDDRDRTIAAWLSFVQQGIPYHCEHRFQRADGSVIWVLGQAIAEKDAEENIIGYIGTITDITERKESEQLLKEYNQILESQVQQRTTALTQMNSYLEQEIAERKQIEAQLRRSETKLSAILDNAGACIYIEDLNGTYTYVNSLTEEFFGCSKAEIIGANDHKFFAEELVVTYKENNERVTKSGLVHCFEEVGVDRDGELHHFLSTKVPLKNSDGDVYAMCGISTDITELKKTETALRQSEERMQALLSAIPDLMLRHRVDGTYLDVAGDDTSLLVPREMLLGKKLQETPIPEQLKADLLERFQQVAATGTLELYEHDLEKPDGIHSYETRIVKSGTDEVVCLVRDITDRKQMEQALQQSNERFQLATSAVKGFIYDWDLKQNIVLGTRGLFELVGYHPKEAEAKVEWWDEHVHPEDLLIVSQQLSEAFASETQSYYVLEYRLRHRDGHYVYLSDYGTIARDASRRAIRAVGHAIDVSERRKAEAALQKALQAAQAASIAKSRFLSNMSHELRTPLNAILGFSQVMVRSNSLSSDQKEQLKIINRSGEHLLNLINDILSMAKIEAGQTTLNVNRFDLYQLLDDLEQMLKLKAISKGLQLIFERASNIPQYVKTDENKLRQVLINLLGNSIKFTASGQVVLRVKKGRVSKKARSLNLVPETHLLFEVEDTGPGISPEEIQTLFDPFVQTESGRRSMRGTGLGLPISRQFVQMMRGDITVSSQVGKGTIFRFNIFASEVAEADEKVSATTLQVIGLEPNQPAYRILVVEDVQENRQLLSQLLEPLGFEIRAAVNGREAIALWSTWKPHLIFMDMLMPVMDGYEATREIKIWEQQGVAAGENYRSPADSSPTNTTKIIALTASAFDEDRSNIIAAGCDDFIHKPFRESMLFEKIAQHLGVRYIYQEDVPSSLPQSTTPRKLTPEDLNVMPSEWIAHFQQEVLCGNDQLILQLIEEIPESEASLAQTLTNLVNNFRLDILFDLIQ